MKIEIPSIQKTNWNGKIIILDFLSIVELGNTEMNSLHDYLLCICVMADEFKVIIYLLVRLRLYCIHM